MPRNRGWPSAPALVSGSDFRSPNQPDKGRNLTYRARATTRIVVQTLLCYHRERPRRAIWGIPVNALDEQAKAASERVKQAESSARESENARQRLESEVTRLEKQRNDLENRLKIRRNEESSLIGRIDALKTEDARLLRVSNQIAVSHSP